MGQSVLDIAGLSIGFTGRDGVRRDILRGVDLQIDRGETVGIVGESGSGKSTLALAAMGYLRRGLSVHSGAVRFEGEDLFGQSLTRLEKIRGGRVALIPQNPGQSLTPNHRVGDQIEETLWLHSGSAGSMRKQQMTELLASVRLPDPVSIANRYPHELSGGQQQRVAIAMALAGDPALLVLDEPTTGLDVTTRAHILELLDELVVTRGVALLYVTHDLGSIARLCARVVVMYAGEVVLDGRTDEVLVAPRHPYARALIDAIPRLSRPTLPAAIDGRPPAPGAVGDTCSFAERCTLAEPRCRAGRPALAQLDQGVRSRCLRAAEAGSQRQDGAASPIITPRAIAADTVLRVADLAISYARPSLLDQMFGRKPGGTPTVAAVSVALERGETLALVGESGSGKSTILKAVAGLVPPLSGSIVFGDGVALPTLIERRPADQLRRIQLVFQNPDESLNPRHTVLEILSQPLALYFGLPAADQRARAVQLLRSVRLGEHYFDRRPGQLSGGEKQRVAIARAFAAEPDVVLCDEVTSALDVSVQAAVLDVLDGLRREKGTSFVFVSHDLAVVRAFADRVGVLYQGRICEFGPVAEVFAGPNHPYTEALLAASLDPVPGARPRLLANDVSDPAPPARGCPYQRRCPRKIGTICETDAPPPQRHGSAHVVSCHIPLCELAAMQADRAASAV